MSGTEKKVSGAIDWIKGKLQRSFGKATDNKSMQMKGMGNQAKGGVKYGAGETELTAKDLTHDRSADE
ncbi:MAG TPA: CsbD family protein [Chloroflexota bacterium]